MPRRGRPGLPAAQRGCRSEANPPSRATPAPVQPPRATSRDWCVRARLAPGPSKIRQGGCTCDIVPRRRYRDTDPESRPGHKHLRPHCFSPHDRGTPRAPSWRWHRSDRGRCFLGIALRPSVSPAATPRRSLRSTNDRGASCFHSAHERQVPPLARPPGHGA